MKNDITTTTAQDVELHDLAAEIRQLDTKLDKIMLTICEKTALGCQRSNEKSVNAFLAKALPNRTRAVRFNILYAGQQILSRRRDVFELDYGWSVLVEINALPSEHLDWAYEEKRTQRQVKDKLKELKNPDDSQSSPTQPLPEKSDESTFIECNSTSPSTASVVESSLRQSDGGLPECSQVSDVYEGLVSCEEEQDVDPMDTRPYDPNDASDKFDRIEQLIGDIEDIHRELFEGGLSEGQWQDLSQQYGALQYFADIRWQRRRMEMERRRGEFNRLLDEASMGVSPSTSEVPQLD